MQKTGVLSVSFILLLILIFFPVMLSAQENEGTSEDPSIESDWDNEYYTDLYVKGDQVFVISLGTVFPGPFGNNGEPLDPKFTPPVGGMGFLSYNYYFNKWFFIGGEITGLFINTLRGNTLFVVPVGARVGTQFIAWKFEFPLFLSLGMAWHKYRDYGHYGFYLKAGAGAYFRPMHEWSFGITTSWGWFPQWTDEKRYNVDGSFVDIMLSARYHF